MSDGDVRAMCCSPAGRAQCPHRSRRPEALVSEVWEQVLHRLDGFNVPMANHFVHLRERYSVRPTIFPRSSSAKCQAAPPAVNLGGGVGDEPTRTVRKSLSLTQSFTRLFSPIDPLIPSQPGADNAHLEFGVGATGAKIAISRSRVG